MATKGALRPVTLTGGHPNMLQFPDNPLLKPTVEPLSKTVNREDIAKINEALRLKVIVTEREINELKRTVVRQQERIMELQLQLREAPQERPEERRFAITI